SQTFDGRWHGTLDLSPHDGDLLHAALDKTVQRHLRAKRDGDPSLQHFDMAAIRAQALVDLADSNLRREPSERSTPNRHSIALTVQADEHGIWSRPPDFPPGATCDATFYRLVLGQHGEILDVGRATRSWDGPIGTAIRQRDRSCRFPGCDQPGRRCDIHHCTPWEAGGQTTITNGMLLCRFHHTFIHAKRWTATLDTHQQPIFTKPDGSRHSPAGSMPARGPSMLAGPSASTEPSACGGRGRQEWEGGDEFGFSGWVVAEVDERAVAEWLG
ncbi:MAG: HNH endonuclease, partial [Acidimicrobiia bacterium]|nr:HNH endonuclease [Acidimicrobiia bacterium]